MINGPKTYTATEQTLSKSHLDDYKRFFTKYDTFKAWFAYWVIRQYDETPPFLASGIDHFAKEVFEMFDKINFASDTKNWLYIGSITLSEFRDRIRYIIHHENFEQVKYWASTKRPELNDFTFEEFMPTITPDSVMYDIERNPSIDEWAFADNVAKSIWNEGVLDDKEAKQ